MTRGRGISGVFQNRLKPLPWPLLLVFLLLTVGISTSGYIFYNKQKKDIYREQTANLRAVADLKANEISRWINERLGDANLIAENRIFTAELLTFLRDRSAGPRQESIRGWMESLRNNYHYQNVLLLDWSGEVVLALTGLYPTIGSEGLDLMEAVRRRKEAVISDLHRLAKMACPYLDVVAPLLAADTVAGFVLLRIDPAEFLYPMIQSWPTPSPSAETLLVHREGNEVVYLNELRHRQNTALNLRFPLTATGLPATQVVLGKQGVVAGIDYLDVPVLAAVRPVASSSWFIVAKIDQEEVERPLRRSALAIFLVALSLVLAAALLILFLWQRQNTRFRLRQLEAESQKQALVQHFDYLTRYANDIILLCDEKGDILEANERAVVTYGYGQEALLKMNLLDLRGPGEQDKLAGQMRQTEEWQGLLFETTHQKKDGSAFPVEISARAIAVDDKKYFQSIIRNISERKEAEKKLLHANRLYAVLSQVNQAIVRAKNRERLFQDICNVAIEAGEFRMARIGLVDGESRTVRPAFQAGHTTGYLAHIPISIDDLPLGRGPIGTAIRENGVMVCNDIRSDEKMAPWREEAVKRGYLSSATLPLRCQGKCIGALMLYSNEAGFFDVDQVGLLEEVADDIAYALDAMALEAQKQQAESQRETALEALQESEEKYRTLVENANEAIIVIQDGTLKFANPKASKLFGYSIEEAVGRPFGEFIHSDDRLLVAERYRKRLAGEIPAVVYPFRTIHKDGSIRWAEINSVLIAWEDRPAIMSYLSDITDRKRAERDLQILSSRNQAMLEAIPDIIMEMDTSKIYTWANRVGIEFFGADVIGKEASYYFEGEQQTYQAVQPIFNGHEDIVYVESWQRRHDGKKRLLAWWCQLLKDEFGHMTGALASARDITEIKRAEEALRESERKFRETVVNLDESYYSATLNGKLLEHNQAFCRMLGYDSATDLRGTHLPDFWQKAEERQDYLRAFAAAGSVSNYQINARTQKGEKITVLASAHLVKDENNRPQRIEGVFLDISERIRNENEIRRLNEELEQRILQRTAQLETANKELEAFSYSVSHDLRAPLRAIDGFARIVLEEYAPKLDDEGRRLLDVIAGNTHKMGQLIDDLLAFSRLSRQQMAFAPVDLAALADVVFSELKSVEKGRRIELEINALPAAFGDRSLLRLVLQNLLANAIKFTRPRARARIELTGLAGEGENVYKVKDNGVGFDMEYVHKLFGVFQRLHGSKEFEGTGVGLAIVQRIVLRHGGRVWAESAAKGGATFYFSLPTETSSETAASEDKPADVKEEK